MNMLLHASASSLPSLKYMYWCLFLHSFDTVRVDGVGLGPEGEVFCGDNNFAQSSELYNLG